MDRNVNLITDLDKRKIVMINDVRFQSRRSVDWQKVEKSLKKYIGEYFEITETSEKVYIGSDFPDEFSHSRDTKELKGANIKAKVNIFPVIGELIQIATDKTEYPDYGEKHGSKAKYGWYRYNTRFGIPVYNEQGNLVRYNIFSTRMLVRGDKDGKLYLYDFIRTKKKRASRMSNSCTVVNFVSFFSTSICVKSLFVKGKMSLFSASI